MRTNGSEIYLNLYNVTSLSLWLCCLAHCMRFGLRNHEFLDRYRPPSVLMLVQTLNVLDVLNTRVGLIKSSFLVTALQIASRLFVTWFSLWFFHINKNHHVLGPCFGPFLCVLAWSCSEVIRFLFYLMKSADSHHQHGKKLFSAGNKKSQSPKFYHTPASTPSTTNSASWFSITNKGKPPSPFKIRASNTGIHDPNWLKNNYVSVYLRKVSKKLFYVDLKCINAILTRLRHSMFFVLYPLGITGEILSLYGVEKMWKLPPHFLTVLILLVYPIGAYYLVVVSAYGRYKKQFNPKSPAVRRSIAL